MSVSKEFFEKQVLGLLGALEGVARRLTRNEADAEDLVAETVSRAWRALDTLEHEAAFRSWMFRILNNAFVSGLRRADARPKTEPIEGDDGEGAREEPRRDRRGDDADRDDQEGESSHREKMEDPGGRR